jgi:peptide deformylase
VEYFIRYYGDPVLREKTTTVETVDEDFKAFVERLAEMMYEYDGVGLAAPQIGVSQRVFVMDDGRGKGWKVVINPEIIEKSKETSVSEEGCLSLPEIWEEVERPIKVKVRYTTLERETVEEMLEGYPATIFQHETDHLNGVLFVDHLSVTKRRLLRHQLSELQKKASENLKHNAKHLKPVPIKDPQKIKETM